MYSPSFHPRARASLATSSVPSKNPRSFPPATDDASSRNSARVILSSSTPASFGGGSWLTSAPSYASDEPAAHANAHRIRYSIVCQLVSL